MPSVPGVVPVLCVVTHWEAHEMAVVVIPISQVMKQALSSYRD